MSVHCCFQEETENFLLFSRVLLHMILLVTIVMHLRSFSSGGTTKFLTWTWTWTWTWSDRFVSVTKQRQSINQSITQLLLLLLLSLFFFFFFYRVLLQSQSAPVVWQDYARTLKENERLRMEKDNLQSLVARLQDVMRVHKAVCGLTTTTTPSQCHRSNT